MKDPFLKYARPYELKEEWTKADALQFLANNFAAPGNWTNQQVIESKMFQKAIKAIEQEAIKNASL